MRMPAITLLSLIVLANGCSLDRLWPAAAEQSEEGSDSAPGGELTAQSPDATAAPGLEGWFGLAVDPDDEDAIYFHGIKFDGDNVEARVDCLTDATDYELGPKGYNTYAAITVIGAAGVEWESPTRGSFANLVVVDGTSQTVHARKNAKGKFDFYTTRNFCSLRFAQGPHTIEVVESGATSPRPKSIRLHDRHGNIHELSASEGPPSKKAATAEVLRRLRQRTASNAG